MDFGEGVNQLGFGKSAVPIMLHRCLRQGIIIYPVGWGTIRAARTTRWSVGLHVVSRFDMGIASLSSFVQLSRVSFDLLASREFGLVVCLDQEHTHEGDPAQSFATSVDITQDE